MVPDQVQGALRHGIGTLRVAVGPQEELREDVAERLADVLDQGAHRVPLQPREPPPQVQTDQLQPHHRVLKHALGIGVDRGVEGFGALLEPLRLGWTRQ